MILMEIAVRADFVSARKNFAQTINIVVRPASPHKKGCACLVFIEDIEYFIHIGRILIYIEHQRYALGPAFGRIVRLRGVARNFNRFPAGKPDKACGEYDRADDSVYDYCN